MCVWMCVRECVLFTCSLQISVSYKLTPFFDCFVVALSLCYCYAIMLLLWRDAFWVDCMKLICFFFRIFIIFSLCHQHFCKTRLLAYANIVIYVCEWQLCKYGENVLMCKSLALFTICWRLRRLTSSLGLWFA